MFFFRSDFSFVHNSQTYHALEGKNVSVSHGVLHVTDPAGASYRAFALWLPALMLLMVCCCLIRTYVKNATTTSNARLALSLNLLFNFQDNLSANIILLNSVQMAHALDGDLTYSGWIVGIYKVGGACGIGLFWVALSIYPELWRRGRSTLLVTSILQSVGAVCVLLSAWGAASKKFAVNDLQTLTCMARFLQGIGGGAQQLLIQSQVGHLAPAFERHDHQLSIFVAVSLGLGSAPLFAALFQTTASMVQCELERNVVAYEAVLFLSAVFPLANLYSLFFYPDLSDEEDFRKKKQGATETSHYTLQSFVVILCITAMVTRVFALTAWEAALTILLEVQYGLSTVQNAVVIGLMNYGTLLVRLFLDKYKHRHTVATWIRVLCCIAIMGVLFARCQNMWMLIAGSFLLYPILNILGGFFMGTMQNACLPNGHLLDLKTATLIATWGSKLVGRGLAQPGSRTLLSTGFLNWWGGQLVVVIMGTFVSEVVLFIQRPEDCLDAPEVKVPCTQSASS